METTELQRLASMGNALRPEWPARSLHTFLANHFAARAYGDVAVALAWVCTRTKTETPRLILEAGPWWKAAATDSAHVQRPPRKDEACPNHPGYWADSCAGCAADKLAGETGPAAPANPRGPSAIARQHLAQARAQLAARHLCTHGVDLDAATCHDCPSETPKESK